jgi:hypothetical protein
MVCGELAKANKERVARLTEISVACADRTTATNSSYGLVYSSSVCGAGLACRSLEKNSILRSRLMRESFAIAAV